MNNEQSNQRVTFIMNKIELVCIVIQFIMHYKSTNQDAVLFMNTI